MAKAKNGNGGGSRPTHRLVYLDRATQRTGEVGIGWLDARGHVGIKLNPLVVLDARQMGTDYLLTLFPMDHADRDAPVELEAADGNPS